MNKVMILTAVALVFAAAAADAQMSTSYDRRGRIKGFTELDSDDGTTYSYGADGRMTGFTENTGGDTSYDYTAEGKYRGYSVQQGGITYQYDREGRQRGYTADSGYHESNGNDKTDAASPAGDPTYTWQGSNAFIGTSGAPAGVYVGKEASEPNSKK